MIGGISGGTDLFALFQARTAIAQQAKTATPKNAKDAEAAKVLEEKQQKSEEALRQLKQMNDGMKSQRKGAARQKVDRLKAELQSLRMFSGGDPKAVARQAARIARELGAAAKEYASAGGGGSVSVSGSDSVGASQQAGAEQTGAQEAAAAAEGAAGNAEGEAKSADAEAKAATAEAEKVAGEAQAQAGETAKEAEKDAAKPLTPEEERAAFNDELNAKISESQRRSSEAEADKKFENDVRRAFAEAKAILELQRKRAKEQNRDDSEFGQFAKDVEEAGKAIDEAFSPTGVEPGFLMAQAPVNITV